MWREGGRERSGTVPERPPEGGEDPVGVRVGAPELGGDEHLVARGDDPRAHGLADRLPDGCLGRVVRSGVQVAIPELDGAEHRAANGVRLRALHRRTTAPPPVALMVSIPARPPASYIFIIYAVGLAPLSRLVTSMSDQYKDDDTVLYCTVQRCKHSSRRQRARRPALLTRDKPAKFMPSIWTARQQPRARIVNI
jgi:hypothetical protein